MAAWQTTLTVRQFAAIVDLKMKDRGPLRETEDPCGTTIRTFDGSLADAEGLLAVEQATFDESPYSAEQVRAMLTGGPQRAWLAMAGSTVAGFVAAFPTYGLRSPCWEIDLLAVHPDWAGCGLATRLIRVAAACGEEVAGRTRAVVSAGNGASVRAFSRAGFRPAAEVCNLFICRIEGLEARPWSAPGAAIREAADVAEALPLDGRLGDWLAPNDKFDLILLLAEQFGQPTGYAELIDVQTILYRGVWIESLVASTRAVREALVQHAVNRAIAAGLDEIGAMVPKSDWPWQEALLARGFRSLGDFHWLTAELPLSGLDAPPQAPSRAGRR
jgi:ribosomal protein S18 acetylase RimI-like enzyme